GCFYRVGCVRRLGFALEQAPAQLAVAIAAVAPRVLEETDEVRIARAAAQRAAQVDAAGRKETRVKRAVGGEPRAVAIAAERLADGRDEADLALAVVERVALRDLAAVVRVERVHGPAGMDAVEQLLRRHDLARLPAVDGADVHVLDEAHDDTAAAEVLDEVENRMIVPTALDDDVDLDGLDTGAARGVDSLEHG